MLKLPVLCDRFFSNPSSRVATDQHWEEKTMKSITRRMLLACAVSIGAAGFAPAAFAEDKITLRMSTPASETDQRSVALAEVFAPEVAEFATYQPHYNAIPDRAGQRARSHRLGRSGNVDRLGAGTGDVLPGILDLRRRLRASGRRPPGRGLQRSADGSVQAEGEDELGVKLLSVMYLGRRHVNLRQSKDELTVMTPEDLAGVNLRMPGTDAWQFLGKALGANPTPMAFTEVYTALSTGSVDGQDNPLPTVVDARSMKSPTRWC
jgi:hypothetical protein